MKDLAAVLRAAFTQNMAYKVVSLLFATLLWVWVQTEQRVEERVRANVLWLLPDGLALVEPPIDTVNLTVGGAQAFVRSLRQRELAVEVDLTKAHEGDVSVDLSQKQVSGLPPQVHVVSAAPSQLRVTLDRRLKRKISVAPVTVGKVADGYRVVSIRVAPERVELAGAATVLRGLESVSTEEVDVGELREDLEVDVGLALRKGIDQAGVATRFSVHVDVEPIVVERTFDVVPVLVRDAAWTTATAAVSVVLSGPQEPLSEMSADDVSVMVHIPESFEGASAQVRFGKGTGAHLEVVQSGGDAIKVLSVSPDSVLVTRKE
ncbi:hypothetical protein LBMAG42_30540 [Deltaproteobacteria bacterium]|nr:hypothetical protein LBMAG42_30540 [Deltaproteobacteria bacterium]